MYPSSNFLSLALLIPAVAAIGSPDTKAWEILYNDYSKDTFFIVANGGNPCNTSETVNATPPKQFTLGTTNGLTLRVPSSGDPKIMNGDKVWAKCSGSTKPQIDCGAGNSWVWFHYKDACFPV
ncbi:hypothetical protein F4779DRAFT_284266 [Xylariaceae sp. FL0662B]|nr:hypothetical protein F4779DRAFT_284266 [Xylariaceae sp. FL0662B]